MPNVTASQLATKGSEPNENEKKSFELEKIYRAAVAQKKN